MLAKLLALLLHSKSAAVSAVFVLGTTGALVSATTQNGVTTITVTQTTESSSQVTTSDKDNDKDEHSSTKSPPTTTTANAQSCAADAQARNAAVRTVDTTFVQDFTALNTLARTKGEKGKEAAQTADKVLMQLRQDAVKAIHASGTACVKEDNDESADADEDTAEGADEDKNDEQDNDDKTTAATTTTTTTVTTGADPAAIAADAVAKMTLAFNTAKSTIDALPTVAQKDATTRKVEIQRSGTKGDKPATRNPERD